MYKVLIVDDEKIVRLAIKSMIRWEESGLEFAGSAGNGEDALKLCRQNPPDIVITDLKMPGMDGIELIKRLKADTYDGEILVLSNFNDFDLVREAMKYGAYDYILKVTVDSDGFMKVMQEIVTKLNGKRGNTAGGERKRNLSAERASLLRKIIKSEEDGNQRDKENLFALGGGACLQAFAVLYENGGIELSGNQILDVLNNIASDLSSSIDFHVSLNVDANHCFLLLHYLKSDKAEDILDPQFVADRISGLAKLYYNRDISVVYGKNSFDFSMFLHELKNCLSAAQILFYKDFRDSNVPAEINMADNDAPIKDLMPQILEKVSVSVREHDKDELMDAVEQLVAAAGRCHLNPAALKKSLKNVLHGAEKSLNAESSLNEGLFVLYPNDIDVIFEAQTDEKLLLEMDQIAESALQRIRQYEPYRKEVTMSMDFIEEHISSKITVSQVAANVNMTETYLSKIFHQETGKSMIDYINYRKMKRAHKMLMNGNCLIKEAADAVGIDDPFYFSRLFKKYYGVNPSGIKRTH